MKDSSKEWTPDQEETSAWTFRLLKSQSLPFEFKERKSPEVLQPFLAAPAEFTLVIKRRYDICSISMCCMAICSITSVRWLNSYLRN